MSAKSNNTSGKPIFRLLNWRLLNQGVKRLFLWFENTTDKTINTKYYLPSAEVKDHNVAIDEQNFSDHPVKNNLRSYDNIWKIVTSQGDDYTISCLLHYN